ncbi:hypothetical protein GXW74_23430 [Roseomonas eburnea]|uniref:Uncharacterized protein n=1 Tax=Neoroseomonas eburnea TaxID=1346889 RepID=A0A9X9XIC2_9PROT|nr:hypothetical protein [Neoroseomonas eburnea]MBR0683458.1 hypothetical protein [Neoroseomonas eburnea]
MLLFLVLLAGCAERWERPGATEADSEAAQAECTARAAQLVPPALVWTVIAPGYWEGPERRCFTRRGRTECVTRAGRFVPPQYGWVDANTGQRRAARAACLQEGGWTYQGLRPLRLW